MPCIRDPFTNPPETLIVHAHWVQLPNVLNHYSPQIFMISTRCTRSNTVYIQSNAIVCRLPSAIHFYLEANIFPNFMRFQEQKCSPQSGFRV